MVSPKEVVQAVMTLQSREKKSVTEKGQSVQRVFLSYRCPKPSCAVKVITFKEKSGFQNPYSHLRSCYGRGKSFAQQQSILEGMYTSARDTMEHSGGNIRQHFQDGSLSEYEQAVFHFIRLIVMSRYPLSCVKDPELRAISRFACVVDTKTIRSVIVALVMLVEDRIKATLRGKKGALLFDGWTENGSHYVAMIVSYTDVVTAVLDGKEQPQNVNRLALIAASPMAKADSDEDGSCSDDDDMVERIEISDDTVESPKESITFNARTHLSFFRDNFQFFGQRFDEWCVCVITDNCSTNRKIATDCGKPMIGCYSHKLNLEVNLMIKNMRDLDKTITCIHETMRAAKAKLKNTTMLRNLTDLSALLPNATRWSGKCHMVNRFIRIRQELIAVSNQESCDLPINGTNVFSEKANKYGNMLKEIDFVTKTLQKTGFTLRECHVELNDLFHVIGCSSNRPDLPLHGCQLGRRYISLDSHLCMNPTFESGVMKLQENCPQDLTDAEKEAISCLKIDTNSGEAVELGVGTDELLTMRERHAKRRKVSAIPKRYMPCNFILGSVAEVERVWSMAKHLLGDKRHAMTPLLLEALLFLRFNERIWDEQLVAQAITHARTERAKERIASFEAEMAQFSTQEQ